MRKNKVKTKLHPDRYGYLTAFLLVGFCAVILYWEYLCGNVFYIFTDCGSDSFSQSYPYLLHEADRFRNVTWRAMFDFSVGLGDVVAPFIPGLDNWVALFGREHIAYLLGISQCLKVILAGMTAYAFARLHRLGHMACLFIALGYAFQAEFIIRGAWEGYPGNALLLMIWLTAYEYAHVKKNYIFLPFATVLFFYSAETYDCVFWGVVWGAYIAFRRLSEERVTKKMLLDLCKTEVLYVVFAFFGMADTLIYNLSATLSSDRLTGNMSNLMNMAGLFATEQELVCGLLRTMGMSINGIGEDYTGYADFLMDPAYYCGILLVLLVPVSIYQMAGKKRKFYVTAYLMLGIFLVVEPVRMIANGFAGIAYKYNALWVITLFLITVMHGLRVFFSEQEKLRKKSRTVFHLTVIAVIAGMLYAWHKGYVVRLDNWRISIGFILLYTVLMNLCMGSGISKKNTMRILCVCMAAEVLAVSWDCVNDRSVVRKEQVSEKGTLYNYDNDYQAAIQYLKEVDKDWYRLEKRTGVCFLCDSVAQDYYGTAAYIGGLGVGMNASGLYNRLGLPHASDQWIYGSACDVYADAVFGVRYYLIEAGKVPDEYGLVYKATVGGVDIYENQLALPLAYTRTDAVSEEAFLKYPERDRRKLLVESCVLQSGLISEKKIPGGFYQNHTGKLKRAGVKKSDGRYILDSIPEGSVLIVRTDVDINSYAQILYEDKDQNVTSRYFNAGTDNETVIYADDIASVWFIAGDGQMQAEFFYQDADTYFKTVREDVAEVQNHAMQIKESGPNYIRGQIDCEGSRILVTSIPYSKRWKVLVDGKEAEAFQVNTGFVGTMLEGGNHMVEFTYETNRWSYDNKFKATGFLSALVFMAAVFVKKKFVKKKEGGFR